MNKSELIEALAARLGGRAQAAAAVEAVVDVVLREVAAGRTVGITGFGTFEKVDRAPRTGRNPRTGEPVPIAGTSTPRFRPGAYFKDVVADPSALPAQGLAGARVGSDGRLERTGAPSSVRRAAEAAGGADGGRAGAGRAGAGGAAAGERSAATRRRSASRKGSGSRTSGAPDSVRRSAEDGPRTKPTQSSTETEVPATGRIMAGGEDITQGMISAKKAQLARVQNDELAAKEAKQARKAKKAQNPKKAAKDAEKDATGKGGKSKGAKVKGEKAKSGKSKGKGAKVKKSKASTKSGSR
jgi:DNA-binding protein HU-beta